MTTAEKDALREKINETLAQLEQKMVLLEDNIKPIAPENSLGRVSRMDAINNKGVAEAAHRQAKRKMAKLKIALTKIDEPNFGNCDNCSNPINPKRLMFMPESTRCIRCADRF